MDTTTRHRELLFSIFGALARHEPTLTRERVMAGLVAAKRRGRQSRRPPAIDLEQECEGARDHPSELYRTCPSRYSGDR